MLLSAPLIALMRKLLLTLITTALVTGALSVACTKAAGPPKPDDGDKLIAQTQTTSAPAAKTPAPAVEAPSEPDDSARSIRIAVVSDLNGSYGSTHYRDEVHGAVRWLVDDIRPDAVLSTGDMVAGQKRGLDYEAMWAGFHAAVTRPLARAGIPFMVTPGNHDASAGAVFMEERITFVEQWKRHRPKVRFVDDAFYPLYYAFEIGPALFISLDATVTGPIDAAQRRWLRGVLERHRDKKAKVVFGHVPLYPFSEERKTEILGDTALEELFAEHDVDLMLSGHHHAYYPGRRDELRLVSMACLGSGPRTLVGTDHTSEKSVAVVDISPDGEIVVEAYEASEHRKIERSGLPESLGSGGQKIWRDDVERHVNRKGREGR
ncbi:hypothetical protein FIV42_25525 [Persicimonas caeni]|uniref:Calcineurin-like phosphoesterase domain-containing protein n=1 Tax=Persicimonas caeni TaxID=2292766 RepID=A0A4Y6Q0H0_PERCE|nr:metallophosphoesterase [Persicimonas caeni]QDG53980.1 hypothetical protein FIV42_25525 [Persicimonas caeni]QED35201.1 hypothetical protein FRD00_25520 [Persicimonas caeni]